MVEIICISKVISAGDMSDIHSRGELLAPSHCPRALGVTHRWLWDSSRLRGLLGFGLGWSTAWLEQLRKDGMLPGCCVRSKNLE